jgi:hypothetical protein
MKTACIIQGDIRVETDLVISEMLNHFDIVILSTWIGEKIKIKHNINVVMLFNDKPVASGITNRNYQRFSTARGLEKAKALNCDYVLKWRTDMLPTNLNVQQLIQWSAFDLQNKMPSRLVTSSFRNLTVYEDWFSSVPDLFTFGHIDMMHLLWGDFDFDYSKDMNIPIQMIIDEGREWTLKNNAGYVYCAETELYAIFKNRLQNLLNTNVKHREIVINYFRLFNHKKLEIIWFDRKNGYRSIFQSLQVPWWSEKDWKNGFSKKTHFGYRKSFPLDYIKQRFGRILVRYNELRQEKLFTKYLKK